VWRLGVGVGVGVGSIGPPVQAALSMINRKVETSDWVVRKNNSQTISPLTNEYTQKKPSVGKLTALL
jgi:hypothetical protein